MKIVLISFLFEPSLGGGSASVANSLALGLAKEGIEVVVITSAPVKGIVTETQNGVRVIRFFPRNFYWVHHKNSQPTWKKVIWQLVDTWNPFSYRVVREILQQEKPDVVHVHKLRGLSPSVWGAAASVHAPQLVHTCHDFEVLSPEGLLMGRVGKLARDQSLIMRPYQSIRRYASRLVQKASAPSNFLLNEYKKMGFFPRAKSTVIANTHGFSQSQLSALYSQLSGKSLDHDLRFLYLGRIDPGKGVELLCEAFVKSAGPKANVHLDILGWGVLVNSLRTLYRQQPNIHFYGGVFGNEKADLLSNCDCVIVPSTAPESFGIVIAEAYAYGKPVIATRVGGIPELVAEGASGFLVEPGKVDALKCVINKVVADPSILTPMRDHCWDLARQFSSDVIIKDYLAFYETGI